MHPDDAAAATDRCLAAAAERLDYLLAVTPVDTEGAWAAFAASGHRSTPGLTYRPLPFDPSAEQRRLAALPVDAIDDPDLARLLRGLRDELLGLSRMVAARGTDAFLPASAEVHGLVGEAELATATAVLDILHGWRSDWHDDAVDAEAFAAAGRAEIARLRARHPDLDAGVELRDDVHGVMVRRRTLLVDTRYRIDPRRVDGLVQHEVGTHVVTEVNGARQPLRCLETGLAGFETTQEGIAVLAEHAVGGLTAERLALLAARVVAARRRCEEAPFADTVAELCEAHGFGRRAAFDIVLRIHRGGGLLKDAGYLRGLARALDHLGGGGPLDPLLVGKVSFDDLDAVIALLDRGVLRPPVVRPRWSEGLDPASLPGDVVALAAALRDGEGVDP